MADTKISALTAATTPLAGTEVLPIVQSGTTKQVSVANLTAGRAVSAASLALTSSPLPVTSGGTGLNTLTANRVPYATAADTLGTSANFQFDGTNAALGGTINSYGSQTTFTIKGTNVSRVDFLSNGVFTGTLLSYQANTEGLRLQTESGYPITVYPQGSKSFTFDTSGNLVPATAAKGINFTANTPAAGKTSQLLNWYEEGTWTPTDDSGASLAFTNVYGYYTRTGDIVTAFGRVTFPVTASALTIVIGGLPFTVANNNQPGGGFIRLTGSGRNDTVVASATTKQILFYANNLTAAINLNYSNSRVDWVVIYKV